MTHVLAIDQGTSGTKAIVVGHFGEVLSIAEIALRPAYLAGGGVEQDPEALFDKQEIVLTVPASFDEAARELTLEAAKLAGLGSITLLEERDAAHPDWHILTIYRLNPMERFSETFSAFVYDNRMPPFSTCVYVIVVPLAVLALGWAVFAHFEGRLAEEL